MTQTVKGSEIKPGMIVGGMGHRYIVNHVSPNFWAVYVARKDGLRDLRYSGFSGHLDPASEWALLGWEKKPQSVFT
jgi:hypothetical protein